ncbi:DEAD/DEAH box helicase [Nocardioides sp. NPDC006303]|uniref:DEAD/DEAH box helicase n=1 Tax=Nocardioides sp. NPDC006303 TaxID=3156747 RepID=UPI0033AEFB29
MSSNIDAVSTSAEITSTYRRYLQSLLAVRDPEIDAALRKTIDETPMLDKGPFLEATPPYAPGASARDLIKSGILSKRFADLHSEALPLDRPLYVHQEQSIRKVAAGRNVVVATGTGSGKTESFLLPILDSLVREQEQGTLGPGVRALLLYPMNALANDQMKRMRQLLANYPGITFGRYTGDTETDPRKAREMFGQLNIGEPTLPNELLSREEMRKTPPHLLLTNFAMLEYLLLRPLDLDLFSTGDDSTWRFLVVDEAHVYDGSQGAEIAMLLRRVKDRVAPTRPIQCIATSATVGSDATAVTRFASSLFGEQFEWIDGDGQRQDLITAKRVPTPMGPFWGPLTAEQYVDRFTSGEAPDPKQLATEQGLATLRTTLAAGPKPFDEVARTVFGDDPSARTGLAAMVAMASAARFPDGTTPLSARYHLFLRATEGAFTCLSTSGPHVQLARHETCPTCTAPVFEIGSCKRCGAVHVVGQPVHEGGHLVVKPRKAGTRGTWLVLSDEAEHTDEDEEAVATDGVELTADDAKICTECGILLKPDAHACARCSSTRLRAVRRLKERGDEIAGCLVCGARGSGTVRVFETGPDASGAVIATSLYQNLPPSSDPQDGTRPGEGRKLLAFSDSRQAAAYFAPYLEDSYGRLQRRRLIAEGLLAAHADKEPVGIDDVVFKARSVAAKLKTFAAGQTSGQQARQVAPWVMAEVVATDDRQSLEGLGLVRLTLDRDPSWRTPAPLTALGLSETEAWDLLQELVRSLRLQGAVTMPEEVPANDDIFLPRLGPIWARLTGSEPKMKVLSWLPTRGMNKRLDYVQRVLAELGSTADPRQLLEGIWKLLSAPASQVNWLTATSDRHLGVVHQVDHERLRIEWVGDGVAAYACSTCRRVAPVSVRGVCPAIACGGRLEPFTPPAVGADRDHYRTVYRSMHAVPLKAMEHTAQWSNTEAAAIQQQFIRGEVNTLSCSTTFELGVDVGELQAVMLRNMPPSTANYLQRAGRAGRRAGAAALVVTYAQRRSHDLTRFAEPEVMITGSVRAPFVPLTNERIDRRHAQSVAMSAFFRWLFETTGRIDANAGAFFLPSDDNQPSVALVEGFLTPVPAQITDSLRRILPAEVAERIDAEGGGWARDLLDLLEKVRQELEADVEALDELRAKAAEERKYPLADRYQRVANTLRKRPLLGFLANRNVLPKYGFPVDTVELRTEFGYGKGAGANLDLTRDLAQAIYEYAPDATIVAGGLLWASRGLYRMAGRDLVEYKYFVCKSCGGFRYSLDQPDGACPFCGEVSESVARTLTIPEFGFVADREPKKPGPRPPKRSWSGAVHVLEQPTETSSRTVRLAGGNIESVVGPRGRMIAVADGPSGRGFWVCEWCGHGAARTLHPKKPPAHNHLLRNLPCKGHSRSLDLGYVYETDLLTMDFDVPGFHGNRAAWTSVLYAVVEAACEVLEIARDDIGGSLAPVSATMWQIVLFDRVSGGAGHVLQVEANLEKVLKAALKRVSSCECGPETSCYGCLRSYQNQREHDDLSRGAAEQILRRLLDDQGEIDPQFALDQDAGTVVAVPKAWESLYRIASTTEREMLVDLAAAHTARPEVGAESAGGVPVPISWPDTAEGPIALDLDLTDDDRRDLAAEGWTVLPVGPNLIKRVSRAG